MAGFHVRQGQPKETLRTSGITVAISLRGTGSEEERDAHVVMDRRLWADAVALADRHGFGGVQDYLSRQESGRFARSLREGL